MPDEMGTDQRFSAYEQELAKMRAQQEQVLGALNTLISRRDEPKEEPLPNITGTEFLDNPAGHITDLVARQMNKLKDDLNNQMKPFADFMTYNQKEALAKNYLEQMEGNRGVYKHIDVPLIRQMVKESILNAPQVNPAFVHAVYLTAVGQAFSTGALTEGGSAPAKKEEKEERTVPAHLRPTPQSSGGGSASSSLPELDENQRRIARERKWTPARAAYMFQLITFDAYKKHEPDGKSVDFGS